MLHRTNYEITLNVSWNELWSEITWNELWNEIKCYTELTMKWNYILKNVWSESEKTSPILGYQIEPVVFSDKGGGLWAPMLMSPRLNILWQYKVAKSRPSRHIQRDSRRFMHHREIFRRWRRLNHMFCLPMGGGLSAYGEIRVSNSDR